MPGINFFLKLYQVYPKSSNLYQNNKSDNKDIILCISMMVYDWFVTMLVRVQVYVWYIPD
jgi:hypothetical protein